MIRKLLTVGIHGVFGAGVLGLLGLGMFGVISIGSAGSAPVGRVQPATTPTTYEVHFVNPAYPYPAVSTFTKKGDAEAFAKQQQDQGYTVSVVAKP